MNYACISHCLRCVIPVLGQSCLVDVWRKPWMEIHLYPRHHIGCELRIHQFLKSCKSHQLSHLYYHPRRVLVVMGLLLEILFKTEKNIISNLNIKMYKQQQTFFITKANRYQALTKSSSFTICFNSEACWVANKSFFESRSKGTNLAFFFWFDVNDKWTLWNLLTPIFNTDLVLPIMVW